MDRRVGGVRLPPYGGACIDAIVPALFAGLDGDAAPEWLPGALDDADRVVLLVLDGLGATQLERFATSLPTLWHADRSVLSSIAPTTTASALTSIVTGRPPALHGLLGYRIACGEQVLNVLRWTTAGGDALASITPSAMQPLPPFAGRDVTVVTKASFVGSGFTLAHLRGATERPWSVPADVAPAISGALEAGARFVYAYLDVIDHAAHESGLAKAYLDALVLADAVVSEIRAALPRRTALFVTADHGHLLTPCARLEVVGTIEGVRRCSGEGRFRWLHAEPGASDALAARCRERFGDVATVLTRAECVEGGLFGHFESSAYLDRLGDVALIAHAPVWFLDPADTGEGAQVSRHGALTEDERLVPLVAL